MSVRSEHLNLIKTIFFATYKNFFCLVKMENWAEFMDYCHYPRPAEIFQAGDKEFSVNLKTNVCHTHLEK